MASRNTIRQYDVNAYYHIYNRGVEKRKIFVDDEDYTVFLAMLKRYLDSEEHKDRSGRIYNRIEGLELVAFCLMPNHFHLFVHQIDDPRAFTKLLHSVCTAYTSYFNRKYKRVGHLFQDRFKASRVTNEDYFMHITRYIHLNPGKPVGYQWSSLEYYLGNKSADWLHPDKVLSSFSSPQDYLKFVRDYIGYKKQLEEIKYSLADGH